MTTATLPPGQAATPTPKFRKMWDVHGLGERLNISWRSVLRLADQGKLPWGCKLGVLRRWDADEIEAWITAGCRPVRPTGRPRAS